MVLFCQRRIYSEGPNIASSGSPAFHAEDLLRCRSIGRLSATQPMLTGTNLKYTKAHNARTVLETIRLFGPLPRTEIARCTELTA